MSPPYNKLFLHILSQILHGHYKLICNPEVYNWSQFEISHLTLRPLEHSKALWHLPGAEATSKGNTLLTFLRKHTSLDSLSSKKYVQQQTYINVRTHTHTYMDSSMISSSELSCMMSIATNKIFRKVSYFDNFSILDHYFGICFPKFNK